MVICDCLSKSKKNGFDNILYVHLLCKFLKHRFTVQNHYGLLYLVYLIIPNINHLSNQMLLHVQYVELLQIDRLLFVFFLLFYDYISTILNDNLINKTAVHSKTPAG